MKSLTAVYYFRVCAKLWSGPGLKVALIMNYAAGEEAVYRSYSRLKMLLLWEAPQAVVVEGQLIHL